MRNWQLRSLSSILVQTTTIATAAPTLVALGFYLTLVGTFGVTMMRRKSRRFTLDRAPRVSVLKPLAGEDDDLMANLESFATLDYPSFELLFGVASDSDPAIPIAQAFMRNHPEIDARIYLTDPDAAVNPKVAQLVSLDRHATGAVVVVSDSNVRVSHTYLSSLVSELSKPGTGLVTSVFAGTGERTLGAALENLQLGAWVAPGIVSSTIFCKRPLSIGKSMAMWRRDLVQIGGFHVVAGVLAEDHLLGEAFSDAGYDVRVSFDSVENRNIASSVQRTVDRHTRWAKMRRATVPLPFTFELLLTPLIVATIVAVIAQTALACEIALGVALLQTICANLCVRIARGRWLAWYYAPLEILRSGVTMLCWTRACVSRRISWRGHPFVLGKSSFIEPAPPSSWSRIRAAVQSAVGM